MKYIDAIQNDLVSSECISVEQAKREKIIPQSYARYISDTCIGCGSDLVTNYNLTKIFCVDPNCILKKAGRAIKLLNNFGVKGIGRVYCYNYFMNNLSFPTHTGILYGKRADYYKTGRIADSDNLMQNIYNIRTTPISYADLISRLALPDLCGRAKVIFSGFNSYIEFENHVIDSKYDLVTYLTGFEGIDSLLADKIARTLRIFRDDLVNITKLFTIKPASYKSLNVCLTGDMDYKNMTKKEFEIYLNILGEGYVDVQATGARMTSDFIISKYANEFVRDINGEKCEDLFGNPMIVDYTAKHNIGKSRNISEGRKVLITPEEMVSLVIKLVNYIKKERC